jgi:HK97 family phage portal protein
MLAAAIEGSGLTYANLEHEVQRYIDRALLPWGTQWEQELAKKLISPMERATQYFGFTYASLLRADLKTRMDSYATAIAAGVLTRNEARRREDLPDLPDEENTPNV